jgi:hypothetical protein
MRTHHNRAALSLLRKYYCDRDKIMIIKYWLKNFLKYKFVSLSFMLLAFLVCFYWGINNGINTAYNKASDKNIYSVYEGNMACPIASLVSDKYLPVIKNINGIESISAEIRQRTTLIDDFPAVICGINPDDFLKLKPIKVDKNIWEKFKSNPDSILIGKTMAGNLLKRYGKLNLKFKIPMNPVGIFSHNLSLLDNMILAHREYLTKFTNKGKNVTVVNVKFQEGIDLKQMQSTIEEALDSSNTRLICRPENQIWERTKDSIAQLSEYVILHVIICLGLVLIFGFSINLNSLRKHRENEKSFINENKINNPILFRLGYLGLNTVAGSLLGSLLAFFIFISQPTFGGTDIFHPRIFVSLGILLSTNLAIIILSSLGCIFSILLYNQLEKGDNLQGVLKGVSIGTAALMVLLINFLIIIPIKMRESQINSSDENSVLIVQEGAVGQAFSNLPQLAYDMTTLVPLIEKKNDQKLITPVIQIAAIVNKIYLVFLGVDTQTYFDINPRIKIIEGRNIQNDNEMIIGKNVSNRLNKQYKIGDLVKYESDIPWKIVGIFEANDSQDESMMIVKYTDLKKATGREAIQFINLKIKNGGDYDVLVKNIRKNYDFVLIDNPDLPNIEIYRTADYAKKMAEIFKGLFVLNGLLIVAVLFILSSVLYSMLVYIRLGKSPNTPFLIVIIAVIFLADLLVMIYGNIFYMNFAMVAINFQTHPNIFLISGLVTLLVFFINFQLAKNHECSG